MSFYIAVGAILMWFFLVGVIKQVHQDAKERREDRVMADYLRAEEARAHYGRLEEIEASRRATTEELIRTAREVSGDVIDGTAVEIGPARRMRQ